MRYSLLPGLAVRFTVAIAVAVAVAVTVAACGGRSQTGWFVGDGGPHFDTGPHGEAGAEAGRTDCFGGRPTSTFAGNYSGTWSGAWSCWGGVTLSGKLVLTLTPVSNGLTASGTIGSFTRFPAISGTIVALVHCEGSTTPGPVDTPWLFGSIPKASLVGSGMSYNLKGELSGRLVPTPGAAPSFSYGIWDATASDLSGCRGSGTWSATR